MCEKGCEDCKLVRFVDDDIVNCVTQTDAFAREHNEGGPSSPVAICDTKMFTPKEQTVTSKQ
jgi:hypothetical protein